MSEMKKQFPNAIFVCESADGKAAILTCDIAPDGTREYTVVSGEGTKDSGSIVGREARGQNGSLPERGVNGFMVEHFIAAAKNELEEFQRSPLPCAENAEALKHLDKALACLGLRTKRRLEQGVEGKRELHETPVPAVPAEMQ